MYHYNIIQWTFLFYFYCFFGWCFESTYVSIKSKRFVNRGFMRGPFLPLYGSGAIMMLVVSMPFQGNVVLVYLAGCVGATLLEYITGVAMEALFKVRYWDYSNQKFQFQGHICLTSTLAWGVLTVLMTSFVHEKVEAVMFAIPSHMLQTITVTLTILLAIDYALAFKAAMDLRDLLVKLEHAREEMLHMQKRLDVLIAVISEDKEQVKREIEERMDELQGDLEDRFLILKEHLQSKPSEYASELREEIAELRGRFTITKEMVQRSRLMDLYKRSVIKNNPDMVSKHFRHSFEMVKKTVDTWKKEK